MFNSKHLIVVNEKCSLLLIALSLTVLVFYQFHLNGGFSNFTRINAPDGQFFYLMSKISALLAFVLMWWQLILSLSGSLSKKFHIGLGVSLFLFITLHVVTFITAVSLRHGTVNVDMLLPDFSSGYYVSAISFGVIAFMVMLVAVLSGFFRKYISKRWRYGHRLVLVMYALVVTHAVMIGSEIQSGLFMYLVYGSVLTIIVVISYRLFRNQYQV